MSGNVTRLAQRASARAYPTVGSAALVPTLDRDEEPAVRTVGPRLRVAPPPPVAVPRAPFVALVLLIVIGGVLGILLLNTKINENAFILHDLRQQQAELDQRQQRLEEEIAAADSSAQLAAAARRLGLVRVDEEQVPHLWVPSGRLDGSLSPTTGEPSRASQGG